MVKRLIVVQEIVGSSPTFHTVGAQRVKDVVWNLFPQTQYRKLSCQSTGLALLSDDVMVSITDFDSVCLGSSPGRITNQRVTQVGEGVTLLT